MLYAVIMAGGSGTRLWPESRRDQPKQLMRVQGHRSMIQATVDRLGDLVAPERVLISTTDRLAGKIQAQLTELPRESMLVEPCPRNTAPCIALAAIRILHEDPEGVMAVMPADHVIGPEEAFQRAIRFGEALVEERTQRLVTFGIRPTYPAESFGYIERGEPLTGGAAESFEGAPPAFAVEHFREKPDADTARQYVDSGRFYWNAGIFLWKAKTVWEALRQYEPEIFAHLKKISSAVDTPGFADVLEEQFAAIRGKSIDYAVMEPATRGEQPFEVVVVEAPFDWDDVGSWRSLERLGQPDADGNLIDAARCLNLGATGTIVRSSDANHVVALMGVKDLIVVVTPEATLVAHKENEESIREVIAELKAREWEEHL